MKNKTMFRIAGLALLATGGYLIGKVLGDAADDPGGITVSVVLPSRPGLVTGILGIVGVWLSRK